MIIIHAHVQADQQNKLLHVLEELPVRLGIEVEHGVLLDGALLQVLVENIVRVQDPHTDHHRRLFKRLEAGEYAYSGIVNLEYIYLIYFFSPESKVGPYQLHFNEAKDEHAESEGYRDEESDFGGPSLLKSLQKKFVKEDFAFVNR